MTFATRSARSVAGGMTLAAAVMIGGCSTAPNTGPTSAVVGKADTAAANLRATLDCLLREHVVLALAATDAALAGRNDEFTAAANSLDANSQELSAAIGSVYGDAAGKSFLDLWRRHIGLIVDYTKGVAANDTAAREKAVSDLVAYTQDFGAFLDTATAGRLKKDAVAELVKTHVVGLKGVIDAQAAKDFAGAFTKERDAQKHMDTIGNALSDAIVDQFPEKF